MRMFAKTVRHLDTPGIFARSIDRLIQVHQIWTPLSSESLLSGGLKVTL